MPQPAKIARKAYELPLLQSLNEMGGSAVPGTELYQRVAEKMGFTPGQEMEYDLVHAREKWVYTLQWVRHNLVKQGDMDGSKRGVWAITEQGQKRIGT
ncbi:MAG: winged helix-turn-helix domain-containing protein [Janthinobacterium lividum]